jgi:hypothetical protein
MTRRWITPAHVLGPYAESPDLTPDRLSNIRLLLACVNPLLDELAQHRVAIKVNPYSKTYISGGGNGGFRPQNCGIGAPNSKHKTGNALDLYDPDGDIKELLTEERLTRHGLYMESPRHTPTWAHLQRIPPASGKRVFIP